MHNCSSHKISKKEKTGDVPTDTSKHTHTRHVKRETERARERRETKDMQEEIHNLSISLFQYPKRLIYGTGSNKEQQQKEKT